MRNIQNCRSVLTGLLFDEYAMHHTDYTFILMFISIQFMRTQFNEEQLCDFMFILVAVLSGGDSSKNYKMWC